MIVFAAAAVGVLLVDQASKAAVARRGARTLRICGVDIRGVRGGPVTPSRLRAAVAWAAVFAAVAAEVAWVPPLAAPGAQAALGCAVGGAAGNVLDCVRRRSVVDFVHLGGWPAFNVADAAITCGVPAALWWLR